MVTVTNTNKLTWKVLVNTDGKKLWCWVTFSFQTTINFRSYCEMNFLLKESKHYSWIILSEAKRVWAKFVVRWSQVTRLSELLRVNGMVIASSVSDFFLRGWLSRGQTHRLILYSQSHQNQQSFINLKNIRPKWYFGPDNHKHFGHNIPYRHFLYFTAKRR